MNVDKTTVSAEGSCNACTNKHTTVWNVQLRTMSFRMCRDCREELLKELKKEAK